MIKARSELVFEQKQPIRALLFDKDFHGTLFISLERDPAIYQIKNLASI
jgi:hypothetical protein